MNNDLIEYVQLLSGRDTKTLDGRSLKTAEETGELASKALAHTQSAGSLHRFVTAAGVLEECADVMLCAMSVAYKLGFSQEELESMMMRKAQKWDVIQRREMQVVGPLPFEIHITVEDAIVNDFKAACASLGVKPIFLALQDRDGNARMRDVMTSSVHLGDSTTALVEMHRIANGLKDHGFRVVRNKIETVPWHPTAPSDIDGVRSMPQGCYFESHLNILIKAATDEDRERVKEQLKRYATVIGAHLSRNIFKEYSPTEFTVMMTLRSYTDVRETFQKKVDSLVANLKAGGFELEKVIVEFACYDDKTNHDAAWLSYPSEQTA